MKEVKVIKKRLMIVLITEEFLAAIDISILKAMTVR